MNKENKKNKTSFCSAVAKFLKSTFYFGIGLLSFYVVLLIVISLLVKEEDKSFKNIFTKLKEIMSTFAMQLIFAITSLLFALIATLPLTYISVKKPSLFSNTVLIIFYALLIFVFSKNIIKTYITSKNVPRLISAFFPSWFKVLFWIFFTVYFLPFCVGIGKKNIIAGIALFLLTAVFANVLFYLDRVMGYFKNKRALN